MSYNKMLEAFMSQSKTGTLCNSLGSNLILTRFEIPVEKLIEVAPGDSLLFPISFFNENGKLYMDAAVIVGEEPWGFNINLVKEGEEVPEKLLNGYFLGGVSHKNIRYFIFITE